MKPAYRIGLIAVGLLLGSAGLWYFLGERGQSQPEEAPHIPAETVTLVILPPHLKAEDPKMLAAAELLCDRLAEELGKAETVRVVDRTQIDRILLERKIQARLPSPMLAYDLMARVSVDTVRPLPQVRLALIDLSTGNALAEKEFAWSVPVDDERLDGMVKLCRRAAEAVTPDSSEKLKMRLLGVENVGKIARLEPLAERLLWTFEESLSRSGEICLVHHLEAATSKEESLLILMGLSRLPGRRRFAPQADVTLRFRLAELDAVGKTFGQTTIRIGFCLEKGGKGGQWASIKGKVADWDTLAQSAWRAMSKELSEAQSRGVADLLDEMAVRRKQAEAELAKFDDWANKAYSPKELGSVLLEEWSKPPYHADRLERLVQGAATAAKIDPTCEEAAFLGAKFNYLSSVLARDRGAAPGAVDAALREVLQYLQRFTAPVEHRTEMISVVTGSMYWRLLPAARSKPLLRLGQLTATDLLQKGAPGSAATVDLLRRVVDVGLWDPARRHHHWAFAGAIRAVYLGMRDANVPTETCRQWRDRAFARADARLQEACDGGLIRGHRLWIPLVNLPCVAIEIELAEGRPDAARAVLAKFIRARPYPGHFYQVVPSFLEQKLAKMPDPKLEAELKRWQTEVRIRSGRSGRKTLSVLKVSWPKAVEVSERERPTVPGRVIEYRGKGWDAKGDAHVYATVQPIGVIGRRLYIHYTTNSVAATAYSNPKAGYVPLDEQDRPIGPIVQLPRPEGLDKRGQVWAALVLGSKAYIGTTTAGIVVYDHRKDRWSYFRAEHGLPHLAVYQMRPLDDHRLLCVGGEAYRSAIVYILDVASGKVTLLQRTPASPVSPFWTVRGVWRSGKTLMGMYRYGIIQDMLAPRPRLRPWPITTPDGWKYSDRWKFPNARTRTPILAGGLGFRDYQPSLSVATVKGRHFVLSHGGLREIDDRGRTVRSWGTRYQFPFKDGDWGSIRRLIVSPGNTFAYLRFFGHDQSHLYFWSGRRGLFCYDPARDLWYGPVTVEPWPMYGAATRSGICLDNTYVAKRDLIAAATKAGLVRTSEQLRQRRLAILDAASADPMDQAKFACGQRRFDKARRILDGVLAAQPNHPEAILLMCLIYGPYGLDQPKDALKYYRRAAALDDTPKAALAGHYHQYLMHMRQKNWQEALKVGRTMVARFFTPLNAYPKGGLQFIVVGTNRRLAAKVSATTRAAARQKNVKRTDGATSKGTEPRR